MLRFLRLDLRLGDLASSENHSRRHRRFSVPIRPILVNSLTLDVL